MPALPGANGTEQEQVRTAESAKNREGKNRQGSHDEPEQARRQPARPSENAERYTTRDEPEAEPQVYLASPQIGDARDEEDQTDDGALREKRWDRDHPLATRPLSVGTCPFLAPGARNSSSERIWRNSSRVGADGSQLGVVTIEDALRRAEEAQLDLVEVAPKAQPPVCRILDYGKFKYQEHKKEAEARRNGWNVVYDGLPLQG